MVMPPRQRARANPERVPQTVGHNLTRLRQREGWTQAEAAEALGLSVREIQRLEAGANITILRTARLAYAYGVPTAALFEPPRARIRRQPGRPRKRWQGERPRGGRLAPF